MPRKDNDTITNYNGYALTETPTTFSTKKLSTMVDLVDTMCMRHSKNLVTRFDLRYPKEVDSDGSNHDFSKAINTFTKKLNSSHIDVQYIAKREQVNSNNPHYHVAVIVDGNKRCNHNNIIREVELHWAKAIGVDASEAHAKQIVHPCNKDPQGNYRPNGYMVKRVNYGLDENKSNVVRQLSYLCKADDNDITPSSTRKWFVSQYKQDFDKAEAKLYYFRQKLRLGNRY